MIIEIDIFDFENILVMNDGKDGLCDFVGLVVVVRWGRKRESFNQVSIQQQHQDQDLTLYEFYIFTN